MSHPAGELMEIHLQDAAADAIAAAAGALGAANLLLEGSPWKLQMLQILVCSF